MLINLLFCNIMLFETGITSNTKSREGNQTIRWWTLQGPTSNYYAA